MDLRKDLFKISFQLQSVYIYIYLSTGCLFWSGFLGPADQNVVNDIHPSQQLLQLSSVLLKKKKKSTMLSHIFKQILEMSFRYSTKQHGWDSDALAARSLSASGSLMVCLFAHNIV